MYKAVLVLLVLVFLATACGSPDRVADRAFRLAPVSALSPRLRQSSPEIQEAYRFALGNRDILTKIPCYCGCGNVGHMDNYMCYVQPEGTFGQVIFDYHAVG